MPVFRLGSEGPAVVAVQAALVHLGLLTAVPRQAFDQPTDWAVREFQQNRGLFVDGTNFLLEVVRRQSFFDFYSPRLYAMYLGQIPVVLGVRLGVTDLPETRYLPPRPGSY